MRTAYMAIGLAAIIGVVPASFAQAPRVAGQSKSAGTATESPGSGTGVSIDAPIGKVWVGPEFLDGEPVYARGTTGTGGMKIVEVSTTPFMPVLGANQVPGVGGSVGRSDQPAPW
jgi:hypothetical protein